MVNRTCFVRNENKVANWNRRNWLILMTRLQSSDGFGTAAPAEWGQAELRAIADGFVGTAAAESAQDRAAQLRRLGGGHQGGAPSAHGPIRRECGADQNPVRQSHEDQRREHVSRGQFHSLVSARLEREFSRSCRVVC